MDFSTISTAGKRSSRILRILREIAEERETRMREEEHGSQALGGEQEHVQGPGGEERKDDSTVAMSEEQAVAARFGDTAPSLPSFFGGGYGGSSCIATDLTRAPAAKGGSKEPRARFATPNPFSGLTFEGCSDDDKEEDTQDDGDDLGLEDWHDRQSESPHPMEDYPNTAPPDLTKVAPQDGEEQEQEDAASVVSVNLPEPAEDKVSATPSDKLHDGASQVSDGQEDTRASMKAPETGQSSTTREKDALIARVLEWQVKLRDDVAALVESRARPHCKAEEIESIKKIIDMWIRADSGSSVKDFQESMGDTFSELEPSGKVLTTVMLIGSQAARKDIQELISSLKSM